MELYQVEVKLNGNIVWLDMGLTKSEHRDPDKYIKEKLQKKYKWEDYSLISYNHIGTELKI